MGYFFVLFRFQSTDGTSGRRTGPIAPSQACQTDSPGQWLRFVPLTSVTFVTRPGLSEILCVLRLVRLMLGRALELFIFEKGFDVQLFDWLWA